MSSLRPVIQRYKLLLFFILACAPIWVIVSLQLTDALGLILSTLAPTLAALLLIGVTEGRAGFAALWRQTVIWRVKPVWVIAAIVVPALCVLMPILMADQILPEAYEAAPITAANQAVLGGVFIFAFLEELGWMGFAMPRILNHRSALFAAFIVGLMQGVYHFPVLLLSDAPISIVFALLTTLSIRVLMTWIYLPTRGSVLIAALFHGTLNIASSLVVAGINPSYFNVLYSSGFGIAALVVILATGRSLRPRPSRIMSGYVDQKVTEQS